LQLPPTVLSDVAAREGYSETLFQRAHAKWGRENVAVMLTTQYRMHEDIMSWASRAMYDGALLASEDARGRTLRSASGAPMGALQLVDTAGCDCDERQDEEGASRDNPGEAAVAMRVVADLIASGAVAAEDVGIITPYSAQVGTLRDLRAKNDALFKDVEISTVDGFQGREKEAIVISAVRSNERGDVGFLADARRMNVAVTRARARCVLVCDTETIARKDAFLAGLVKHFETRGEYISAAELQED
jgi:superfamily I DNA and/or RNA helicase